MRAQINLTTCTLAFNLTMLTFWTKRSLGVQLLRPHLAARIARGPDPTLINQQAANAVRAYTHSVYKIGQTAYATHCSQRRRLATYST